MPDFGRLLDVLHRKPTQTPVLFEFFLNESLYQKAAGEAYAGDENAEKQAISRMAAYDNLGYDYVMLQASDFAFPTPGKEHKKSHSLNDASAIVDRATFDAYPWPDASCVAMQALDTVARTLPEGMGGLVCGPCGILENSIGLMGYDRLCYTLYEDPDLIAAFFHELGSRITQYYHLAIQHPGCYGVMVNDDLGFNTQTMLSPAHLRQYVFPWYRKIVTDAHAHNKVAMLHACGNMDAIWDDIVDIGFDGKHSFEDVICPIEQAYDDQHHRIALLGGIDLDFLCRNTPDAIRKRVRKMIEKTAESGGWAVGSGNSIPYYVPDENYFAMIDAARDMW